jgi:hypothetical protein
MREWKALALDERLARETLRGVAAEQAQGPG